MLLPPTRAAAATAFLNTLETEFSNRVSRSLLLSNIYLCNHLAPFKCYYLVYPECLCVCVCVPCRGRRLV